MAENINEIILDQQVKQNLSLAKTIRQILKEKRSSDEAFSFIITGLKLIYRRNFSENEFKKIITDGDGDLNFDAIYMHKDYIDIFDFSYKNPKSDQMLILEKSFCDNIINKPKKGSLNNDRLKSALEKIHQESNKIIRLFVIRKSNWKNVGYEKEMKLMLKKINGKFIYFNKFDLVNQIVEPEHYLPEWKFSIEEENQCYFCDKTKEEAFFRIPIKILLELQKQNEEKGMNLFNKNVRTFLNNKNLSDEMNDVLQSSPEKFHLYHNGITITTPNKIQRKHGSNFIVDQPQIVNGAQTINSLYKLYKEKLDYKNLKDAKILCKIVCADKDLTNKICETSNTQIPIKLWDLRANDDSQLKLEEYINSIPIQNYQYKRKGGLSNQKLKTVILLSEFTQWMYSYVFEKPAFAKNRKKLLFDIVSENGQYHEIEKHFIDTKKIDLICRVGVFLKKQISKADKDNKRLLRDMDMHIVAGLCFLIGKKGKKDVEKCFKLTFKVLKKHIDKRRKAEPDITNNKIFTKSVEAWDCLKKQIKK